MQARDLPLQHLSGPAIGDALRRARVAAIKAARAGLSIAEVPVNYRRRIGVSKVSGTVKGTILAGYKILYTIARFALARG